MGQQVQRSRGMRELGTCEEQAKDLSGWSSMTEGRVNGRKGSQRESQGLVITVLCISC